MHLSEEDIKRLTAEARDEFEERQKEAGRLAGAIVIDPSRHPEVALAQLQVLAAQVDLLVKAAGAGNLLAKIQVLPAEQALERERLAALIALVESVQPSSNENK